MIISLNRVFLIILIIFSHKVAFAQNASISNTADFQFCDNSFHTIGDITISEGSKKNIASNNTTTRYYLKIKLPSGFAFDNTVTPGLAYNGNATFHSQTLSATMYSSSGTNVDQFEFGYDLATTAADNESAGFTLSGLKVKCVTLGASGNINRVAASSGLTEAVITGLTIGSTDNYGTLTSVTPPAQPDVLSISSPICFNSSNRDWDFNISNYVTGVTYKLFQLYARGTGPYPNINSDYWSEVNLVDHNNGSFTHQSDATDVGKTRTYHLDANQGGCFTSSTDFDLTFGNTPTALTETKPSGTTVNLLTTDDPYPLNQLVNNSGNLTLVFDDVISSNNGVSGSGSSYSFSPSAVTPNATYYVNYTVTTSVGCSATFPINNVKFIVSDDKTTLPTFIKVPPPLSLICENSNYFKLKATIPQSLVHYPNTDPTIPIYLSYKKGATPSNGTLVTSGTYVSTNPLADVFAVTATFTGVYDINNNAVYDFYIDPSQHIKDQYYIYVQIPVTYILNFHFNFNGNIPIFPRRNPLFSGLTGPARSDTVYVCSASNEVLNVRGNPAGGSYNYYKGIADLGNPHTYKFTKFKNGLSPFTPPFDDISLQKITPSVVFKDSLGGDYKKIVKIVYTYPAQANGSCPDSITRILKFLPPVNTTFIRQNQVCYGDTVKFNVTSRNIRDKFTWNFGDGFSPKSDSILFKRHFYSAPGIYPVRFQTTMFTLDSLKECNNDIIDSIRVGSMPTVDYLVTKNFIDSTTIFNSLDTILVPSISDRPKDMDTIVSWEYKIRTSAGYFKELNPKQGDTTFIFPTNVIKEPYVVTHIATAKYGCVDSAVYRIPVFPVHIISQNKSSLDTFNINDKNGWYESGQYLEKNVNKSSWDNVIPDGNVIKGPGFSWATWKNKNIKDHARYFGDEISWVESPVYNISSLDQPMVSMDAWANLDNLFDGVSLQYAFCDNVPFGKEQWHSLGNVDQGLNWFNSETILSAPGGDNKGWTSDTTHSWKLSAYRLDTLVNPNKDKLLRFRVILGSDKKNTPTKFFDGFAFDNFYVGQRNRRVVVEEFCDFEHYIDTIDNAFKDPQALRIQYHVTDFTNDDLINPGNKPKPEPGARSLLYGIGTVLPLEVIDGIHVYRKNDGDDKMLHWSINEFFKRSLQVSPFNIKVEAKVNASTKALDIKAEVTKKADLKSNRNYVVQIAVVENKVVNSQGTFTNVLRNMLPNAAGYRIDQSHLWVGDDTTVTRTESWRPFVAPSSGYYVIVFVQDEDTKEIYQSSYCPVSFADASTLSTTIRTLGVIGSSVSFNELTLSPNPTSAELKVTFNGILNEEYAWTMFDALGNVRKSGTVSAGCNLTFFQTEELESGIYYLKLEGEGQAVVKKFSVVK